MKRFEIILLESELQESWGDSNCPNLEWTFVEQSLDECLQDDGTYKATYETLEIPAGESFSMTYLCEETGGTKTYTITEGEYGIKQ
jgi:hypothetical protein